ncbi:MAG: peptidase, partial [Actinomycetales bacterium]
HYVLVSTRDGAHESGPVDFRSYRIVDGEVTEEEVRVVERYDDAAPEQRENV